MSRFDFEQDVINASTLTLECLNLDSSFDRSVLYSSDIQSNGFRSPFNSQKRIFKFFDPAKSMTRSPVSQNFSQFTTSSLRREKTIGNFLGMSFKSPFTSSAQSSSGVISQNEPEDEDMKDVDPSQPEHSAHIQQIVHGVNEMDDELAKLSEGLHELTNEQEILRKNISDNCIEIQRLRMKIQRVDEEFNEAKREANQQMSELREEYIKTVGELSMAETREKRVENESSELEKQLIELENDLRSFGETVDEIRAMTERKNDEARSLKGQAIRARGALESYRAGKEQEKREVVNECKRLREEVKESEKESREWKQKAGKARREAIQKKSQANRLPTNPRRRTEDKKTGNRKRNVGGRLQTKRTR